MSLARIMIIDDCDMMRKFLEMYCTKLGKVSAFNNVEDALDNLSIETLPDIIILDLNLPGLNGKDLMKKLYDLDLFKKISILVLSGDTRIETKIECLEMGAEDYLTKPFHPKELMLRIKSLLNKRSLVHLS